MFKRYTGKLELLLAGLGVLILAVLVMRLFGIVMVAGVFVVALIFGKYVMRKLPAGLTGDSYGAVAELSEMLTWLVTGAAAGVIKSLWF